MATGDDGHGIVYADLARDSWHTRAWADKLRVWIKPPGWRPADVAARFPKPSFELAAVRRWEPALSQLAAWAPSGFFLLLFGGTTAFLWNAHRLSLQEQAAAVAGIVAGLWAVGAVSTPRVAATTSEQPA